MKYKNYYEIMGLSGPGVTEEEIKVVYRKLAKKYHPDAHPDDATAGEKFADINEAYRILSDDELRFRYNIRYRFHTLSNIKGKFSSGGMTEFSKIFVGNNQNEDTAKTKGEDIFVNLEITIDEAFNGATKQISFKNKNNETKNITVKIPRGANHNDNIRLKEQGNRNSRQQTPGDLFIIIKIKDDSRFKLEKNDLTTQITVSPLELILGGEYSVSSVDSKYNLKIPAGSRLEDKHIVKDAGFIDKNGKRGNLIVTTKLEVPKDITSEERELYTKLYELQKKRKTKEAT